MVKLNYPSIRRDDEFVEKIHDVNVPDPYRWLENAHEDKEIEKFCKEQQALTMSYVEQATDRNKINKKLIDIVDYPKFECPFKRGNHYYMSKNTGLQNQNVTYTFDDLQFKNEQVFLDPNLLCEQGTSSVSCKEFSKDNKLMAYAVSHAGSDWLNIRIRDVETKKDLDDELQHCKFTNISWTHDNKGFFYSKYECDENHSIQQMHEIENHKVYYHRINTPQSEDVLIYENSQYPKTRNYVYVSDCGKFLHLNSAEDCVNSMWHFAKLDENMPIDKKFKFYPIVDKFQGEYSYITENGNLIYFVTDRDAPNKRICRADLTSEQLTDSNSWVTLVPEFADAVIDDVVCVDNDKIALVLMRNVVNEIEIRNLEDGKLIKKLEIPIGSVLSLNGERKSSEIFFHMASFLTPGTIYHYDFAANDYKLKIFDQAKIDGFVADHFVTEQFFFNSKDGQAKIPIFVTHHKDIQLDGSNPCLLYGYGGFQISITPSFSAIKLLFMQHFKGVYAVANIRGGGEYGSSWYDSGKQLNKQKSYDDFQQAAEYLIEKGFSSKSKMIIEGGSNGGLLVATCGNQRPDLFAAVICHVGVLDLLRFQKFTIGRAWVCDYGDHEEEGEKGIQHLHNQLKISPYHNVPQNCAEYPATFVLTSDHDDRVAPAHSFKFIAQLQHSLGAQSKNPLLLRVDMKAGHGRGKPISKIIDQYTDIFCFLQRALDLKFYN